MICLLAMVSGCQNSPDPDLVAGSPRRSSNITVFGHVAGYGSRTELDAGGFLVKWSVGDTLGLFTSSAKNAPLAIDASCVGSTDGVFVGTAAGSPKYAYYPYCREAAVTSASVALQLPETQCQRGAVPDMTYDVKVGKYVSGDSASGYVFEFAQKMVMLHFVLTPDSSLAGDTLRSVSFADAGRTLAGVYSLDLADPASALSFGTDASDRVVLSFADSPVLAAGTPVEGWMFINADVRSGDALTMAVLTDNHRADINVSASKDFRMGWKYRMPLDMATLVASGSAVVSAASTDITGLSDPGVYDCMTASYKCRYEAGANQYVTSTVSGKSQFRIQNLNEGYSLILSIPSTLSTGDEGDLTVQAYGLPDVPAGTFHVKVVKVEAGKVWLMDEIDNVGYIMTRE